MWGMGDGKGEGGLKLLKARDQEFPSYVLLPV